MGSDELLAAFRERARTEADRYGSDPWVFVRELLQNARDAGASRVWFETAQDGERERVVCRDDGAGLELEEARRFLFALYASSKAAAEGQAGRFGVGFWSVLRFEPEQIVVRSRGRRGPAWELLLEGSLESACQRDATLARGTEIVLERRARGEDLGRRVLEAVQRDAPFLRRNGPDGSPLEVAVNGQRATSELGLPAPCSVFRRRGVRGAVALAREPRVDLYAFGLRVRTTPTLEDLLLDDGSRPDAAADLPDGVFPRAVLDSDRLEVLMARRDARDDRELHRLVNAARRELEWLVRRQLDRWAPQPLLVRAAESLRALAARRWARIGASAVVAGCALGVAVGLAVLRTASGLGLELAGGDTAARLAETPRPYSDLLASYSGPSVSGLGHLGPAVELSYRPPHAQPLLAILWVTALGEDGRVAPSSPAPIGQLASLGCGPGCLELELEVDAARGTLRLPLATGHGVDRDGVRLGGEPAQTALSAAGEPLLVLPAAFAGRVSYRTAPVTGPSLGEATWPALPGALAGFAESLRGRPLAERVAIATAHVRELVAYDRSSATAARYAVARRRGAAFFSSVLAIGAGDCDVQNALLAAVLDRAGVASRLALGVVGRDGRALPGLHAWVEHRDASGSWQAADASAVAVPAAQGGERGVEPAHARVAAGPAGVGRHALEWLGRPAFRIGLALALCGAGALLLGALWSRRRVSHRLALDDSVDASEVLRGALRRPESFAHAPAVFTRPLVPLLGGRQVSLRQAQALAEGGELYRSQASGGLAARAAARGAAVVDGSQPCGRAVAGLLGAVDLDRWDGVVERCAPTTFTEALDEVLREHGLPWRTRVAAQAPAALASLEIPRLGMALVVLDRSSPLCAAVASAHRERPAVAVLLLADAIAHEVALTTEQRGRLLGQLAGRAVTEAVGR